MSIPSMGYLTLALLCGELARVVTLTFPMLIAGLGPVLVAMRRED